MDPCELEQRLDALVERLTPSLVYAEVHALLRQGQDIGGGIGATRLVRHLVGAPHLSDAQATRAYDRLRTRLRAALEQVPSLVLFEGD